MIGVCIEEVDVNALTAVHHHRLFGVEVVLENISHLEAVLDGPFDILKGIRIPLGSGVEDSCGVEERIVVPVGDALQDRFRCSVPGDIFRVDVDEEDPRPFPVIKGVIDCIRTRVWFVKQVGICERKVTPTEWIISVLDAG